MKHIFIMSLLALFLLLPQNALAKEAPVVELHTSMGLIVIELNQEKAPVTTKNFMQYVQEGFYDNTIFHRVIPGFMIQGGGMTADMKEKKTHASIKNEADNGLSNDKYTIAMARTSDPHSASAQFFINSATNPHLNHKSASMSGWGYCVFGKVIEGQDVVDAIEKVSTGNKGGHQNVPATPIVIEKAVLR